VQETEFTEKSCLKNVQMDEEEALELKLEATKRKLHQRYQQAQNSKRKIQVLDFKDISLSLRMLPRDPGTNTDAYRL
jgi:hypothetical protein